MVADSQVSLRIALRRLWADHVNWTRSYVVAAVADAADASAAAGRLLKNQEDIGNAVVPFYGADAGKALSGLLKEHILIAVELIKAAKANDQRKFGEEDAKWTKNAEGIAGLLSSANPYWKRADVVDLLALHLKLTKDEVVARLTKKWDDDVRAFDEIFTEIMTLSDALADGVVKQFPDKFRA